MDANEIMNRYYGSRFFAAPASARYIFSDHFDQYTPSGTSLYAFDEFNPLWQASINEESVNSGEESAIYRSSRSRDALGNSTNVWASITPGAAITSSGIRAQADHQYQLQFMALTGASSGVVDMVAEVLKGMDASNAILLSTKTISAQPGLNESSPEAWHLLPFFTGDLNNNEQLFLRFRYAGGSQWLQLDHVMLQEIPSKL